MNKDLIQKYLSNNCTSEEVEQLFSWIAEDSNKSNAQLLLKNHWDSKLVYEELESTTHKQQRLDRIHHKINLNNSEKKGTKNLFLRIFYRAALILLIPVLTLFVYTHFFERDSFFVTNEPVLNEIISPIGSRVNLELSDGTKVWLNHGSSLVYPQKFVGKSRKVKLSGEGFFEVSHNPSAPFVVETENFMVTALGTKFNVKAYSNDNTFETTLQNGMVEVSGKNLQPRELKPNQLFVLNKTDNKYKIVNVDTEKYVSWKDGKLVFKEDDFENIASRLSRWYNVKININDPEIKALTFTATFIDEPLYQILEMLAFVAPIEYTISERHKLPDGTYSKKDISIYSKKPKE